MSLKEISNLAEKFENVEQVKTELKRIQSIKCRLKKQKAREDYDIEMTKIVSQEQTLKEVRDYFEPKPIPVTKITQKEIDLLDYESTRKAILAIQSKKCNSQYLTNDITTNVEYQEACRIESLLLEHKKVVKPIPETTVKKSDIQTLISHIETLETKVKKEHIVELLNKLIDQA